MMSTEDSSSEAMAQLLFGNSSSSDLQQTLRWPDEDDDPEESHSTQNCFPYNDNSSSSCWYPKSSSYSGISDDLHSSAIEKFQLPTKKKAKVTDIVVSKKGQKNREDHSNCCSLEDDSSADQEIDDSQLTQSRSKGSAAKSRAKGGSSIDSQSIYARRRRERINQKLRILQGLVPNGTKVDTSTMLEEAVQYVKFLHLQIKLLSSDDMWMYAPIAHNAMNMLN